MHFEDTLAFNNIYIVKTNLNGDSITSAKILSTSLPFGIYSLGNDGYIMASSKVSNNSYSNLELTRLDTAFQVTGTRQYRYKNFNERCFSFKTAYDGTFLVAASADSVFNRNIHILKIKPDLCVDPVPSFTINYNTGYGPGVSGIIINNTSDYGIADSINTTAMIYFGDGDSADFFVDSLSHIYPGQGTYTITVVITTPCGTQSYSQLVVVPCSGQPSSFTYTSNLLTINTGYNFSGSFYNWDFGDGGTANTQTATHTYGSSGTYYVCLSTANSCGNIQICDSVTVDCTAPVIPFLPVAKACIGSTISIDAGSRFKLFMEQRAIHAGCRVFNSWSIYSNGYQ
ncbi:MAG: PKD domain-containing protein [Bacteroidetes bacterium]|nr:PKD domain-containing protein [Bacteroidota bacterium]